jgi:hypothetical protein
LDIPKSKCLTKVRQVHGTKWLEMFQVQVWNNANEKKYRFLLPQVFLPDGNIKLVLDYFALLNSLAKFPLLLDTVSNSG